jgi:hypothetical protein
MQQPAEPAERAAETMQQQVPQKLIIDCRLQGLPTHRKGPQQANTQWVVPHVAHGQLKEHTPMPQPHCQPAHRHQPHLFQVQQLQPHQHQRHAVHLC